MTKKIKPSGVCIFCKRTGVTKQHFWPDWMKSVITRGEDEHTQFLTQVDMTLPGYAFIKPNIQFKRGHAGARKIRKVCRVCNSGWMSTLETAAKPSLSKMILDENVQLSSDNQREIAAWTMMTAIIGEYTDIATQSIPAKDRQHLMDNRNPNNNWRVWLGRYGGDEWKQHYRHAGMAVGRQGFNPVLPSYNTQSSTFVAGALLIHAASSTCLDPDTHLQPNILQGLVQIWPTNKVTIDWPPKNTLTHTAASKISESLYLTVLSLTAKNV